MIVLVTLLSFLVGPLHAQTWVESPKSDEGVYSAPEEETPEEQPLPAPQPAPTVPAKKPAVVPTYLALKPNLNEFAAFADGGWDGNWYIGYNSCWIVRLPASPAGKFARAFIGAKIGRAKTRPKADSAFEQEAIPGKIYMAISSTQSFTAEHSFFLAHTDDLPTQPDANLISGWVGTPGWFWTEVPLSAVSTNGPNYLAIWSNTDSFLSVSSAPILAAAVSDKPVSAWLNRSIRGAAPRDPATALETQLSRLVPALAIKLVPANDWVPQVAIAEAAPIDGTYVVKFAVEGQNVESAWYELSFDMLSWMRQGETLRNPPFTFSLPPGSLGARELYVRVGASDALGNVGYSRPLRVEKVR